MRRSNARVASPPPHSEPDTNNNNKMKKKTDNSMKLKFRPNQTTRPSKNLFSKNNQKNPTTSTRSNVYVFVFLTVFLIMGCCLYVNWCDGVDGMAKRYKIVIDGGSTGSRVHVFEYLVNDGVPVFEFSDENGMMMMNSWRVGPGLSAFAEDLGGAGESVVEMLEFARKRVPEGKWGETEVRLMATAGLRLLELRDQERILEACRKVLRSSGFAFQDDWAEVISGSDEGVYAWVVANYALGTLGGDPLETTGIIELGGASAQVTFFSSDPVPPEFSRKIQIGNVSYSLYSHSLLELGQNVAFDLVRRSNLGKAPNVGSKETLDPCSPKGYKDNLILENVTPSSFVENNDQFPVLHASGNFSECRSASLTLLQKGKEECAYDQCYIGSTFIPKLQGNFLATENFYHTSKFFGLSPKTFLSELEVAGKQFCEQDWSKLKSKYPKLNEEDLHRYCFSSAYIIALLHDSLGIAFDDKRIGCANQVNNIPLDWPFGAFIFQITRDLNMKQSYLPTSILNADSSTLGWLVFVIFLLFSVYYVSKWKKPNVKTIYDLEKGKYIFTRVGRSS